MCFRSCSSLTDFLNFSKMLSLIFHRLYQLYFLYFLAVDTVDGQYYVDISNILKSRLDFTVM